MVLDSSQGPVELGPGEGKHGWQVLGALMTVLPLAVCIAAGHHPVRWWGWLGAAGTTVAALVVALHPPRTTRALVVDDLLVVVDEHGCTTIPATLVERVVSIRDNQMPLLEVGAERILVPCTLLWQGSGYPTARILGNWVVAHGGGRGAGVPDQTDHRSRLARVVVNRRTWRTFGILVVAWFLLSLSFGAIFNHPHPRWDRGWSQLLGAWLGTLFVVAREHRVTTVWTAPSTLP